ncbi:MAG: hypothetical protein K9I85_13620 [Saprospiraceae bacterium]|nr:hypothetical protein [Saprospiraceae bacterium]
MHFPTLKINTMKKQLGVSSFLYIHSILLLLLCGINQSAIGQFQTTIGLPYPTAERSPGGIVLPNGGFALPAENFEHPSSIFGPGNADWQVVLLNASGNATSPSKWIGRPSTESVAWMELASCNGPNNFIVAGSDDGDMTLTLTSLTGVPVPTFIKKTGTTAEVETGACVKVDGSGNYILVGTQINGIGLEGIVLVKVDCNGAMVWTQVYYLNGWSSEAASVTAFSTFVGLCPQPNSNKYYVTGKTTPFAGGNSRVFLLSVDANTGGFDFWKTYDVHPTADDAGTCIQANCVSNSSGEIWISGYSYESAANAETVMMLKTDINGIPIWANNYDIANGDEFATHFTFGPDNKMIVTGKAEESIVFQSTKGGDCMLMSIDSSGNSVDWTRMYINNGFSSQGNRVEPAPNGDYFISGQALELISPSQSANNMLAILTDSDGHSPSLCDTSLVTTVFPRQPTYANWSNAALTLGVLDYYISSGLDDLDYMELQTFCPASSCVCDFTYTANNCFQVDFTATCIPPGAYTYDWTQTCPKRFSSLRV